MIDMGCRSHISAVWLALPLCAAAACAGAGGIRNPLSAPPEDHETAYQGDSAGPPRIEGLPELDVPRTELTEEMRRAWLLTEESLHVPPPTKPAARSAASLQLWSRTTLQEWVAVKSDHVTAARSELNAAAVTGERERVVAGALLGLVYEDFAAVLVDVPIPAELESEPEIANMYRDVMAKQAAPYVNHAEAAYTACKENGRRFRDLRHWGRYCGRRVEVLPGKEIEAVEGEGTQVTVTRD